MLLIVGSVRIPAEHVAAALPAMKTMLEATRLEDGCNFYCFAQDVLDPELLHISESWRDGAALKAHAESAHMAVWRKEGAGFGIGERNLKLYKADDGTAI